MGRIKLARIEPIRAIIRIIWLKQKNGIDWTIEPDICLCLYYLYQEV